MCMIETNLYVVANQDAACLLLKKDLEEASADLTLCVMVDSLVAGVKLQFVNLRVGCVHLFQQP